MSPRPPSHLRAATVQRLGVARLKQEPLADVVASLARQFGVAPRTIWRWTRGPRRPRVRRPTSLAREELVTLASFHGNRYQAWASLQEGAPAVSYRQFCRRLHQTDTDLRAAVTEGMAAAIQAGLYNRHAATLHRADVFGFDHTEVPVMTWSPGDRAPRKMWVSVLVDWGTHYIFSPVFTEGDGIRGDPNTESIVTLVAGVLIGQAVHEHRIGGIPGLLVFDYAQAHLSEAVANGLVSVPVATHTIRPGSPWENGATENAVGVIEKAVWSRLVGYTHHLPTRYGHFPWGNEQLLTPDELIARTVDGIAALNEERTLARLDGRSPLAAWVADPAVVEFADPGLVRHAFLASERTGYVVQKMGVSFHGIWYQSPALHGQVGRTVAVRFLPNDRSFIDVYRGSEFLCTAQPTESLTLVQRSALARVRRSRLAGAERILKAGAQRRAALARADDAAAAFAEDGQSASVPAPSGLEGYLNAVEAAYGAGEAG